MPSPENSCRAHGAWAAGIGLCMLLGLWILTDVGMMQTNVNVKPQHRARASRPEAKLQHLHHNHGGGGGGSKGPRLGLGSAAAGSNGNGAGGGQALVVDVGLDTDNNGQPEAKQLRQTLHAVNHAVSLSLPPQQHTEVAKTQPPDQAAVTTGPAVQMRSQSSAKCKALTRQYGDRFMQLKYIDEQMISGIRGLQEVLLLAKLSNRTLLAPLTGSHYLQAFFHLPPHMDTDPAMATASSFGEVFETERLARATGVNILGLADYHALLACGLWPLTSTSTAATANRTCLACTGGSGRQDQTSRNVRCGAAERSCGIDITMKIPWPGTAAASHMGLHKQTCGPMFSTTGWLEASSGPAALASIPCLHKHTTGRGTAVHRHFTSAFPGNATGLNTPAGAALRFSGPAKAAARFLTQHGLAASGFLGVHWRSEKLMFSTKNGKALYSDDGEKMLKIIRNRLALCNLTKVVIAVDFDAKGHGHGSQSMSNKGAGLDRKVRIYDRMAKEFDVHSLDPAVDYPAAHGASNSMAIAAAELSILSAASSLYVIVDRGTFVNVVAQEWMQPRLTLNIDSSARPARCKDAPLPPRKTLLMGAKFIYRSDDDDHR